ncbi:potassium uptake TrkH family protein [Kineococcus xinjiangensis]|uniref:Potassium uptake TrkH family protein n=1 Tax=Kineococcus xinjiangensis TaxID=512762 RepID=A0A2S6IUZ2_9ACTN|nr:potassium transporter TrkG [Kineococcus xinjiangensis]PPK98081.1 potassium uptake TrkH family protein [Kineococcus xinjiangensis]
MAQGSTPRRALLRHPAQIVVLAFLTATAVGTALLWLPFSSEGPGSATFVEALFTATSALCVTGLVVVDTGEHWTTTGHVVILALAQIGGFGIMSAASLLGLFAFRRLGLRSRLVTATETRSIGLGDVRSVLLGVVRVSLVIEAVTAVVLVSRLALHYEQPFPQALWEGVFLAVSAFNNAGFVLRATSMMDFVADPWMSLAVAFAAILGGLGFPVLLELRRHLHRPRMWSLHTKLTLATTSAIYALGTVLLTAQEWTNPATLGALTRPARLLAGFFMASATRSSGFNSLDTAEMTTGSWMVMDVMMFIGGGSASTAGGIKVTTFALLLMVIVAELRGENHVSVFSRRVPERVHRQALTVALLSVAAVVLGTVVLSELTHHTTDRVLFEVISAFCTVGLSTGITGELTEAGQLLLVVLMLAGRLGPITLGTALALRERRRLYEHPEGRPIIG